MGMKKKNLWLKPKTVKLLNQARVKFVEENPNKKPYDNDIVNEALRVYINGK